MVFLTTTRCANAQDRLSFDRVLQGAAAKSYDLKLASFDHRLAKNDIKQAMVAYMPTMRLTANYEYQYGFVSSTAPVQAVNNVILPTGTRFQNAATLNTMYTLCDFGSRKNTLQAARLHADAVANQTNQQARDMKLRLADVYCDALSNWKAFKAKQKMLTLYQQLFEAKTRLHEAGNVSKVDVMEQAIKVAQTLDEINVCKQKVSTDLQNLSEYTHEIYDPDLIEIADFDEAPIFFKGFVAENTPDYKYYANELSRKAFEIRALRAQRRPQINAYSNFTQYGSDKYNPGGSLSNFGPRTMSLGVSLNWTIFDGYKNEADQEHLALEIERLKTERDQKLWGLRKQADKAYADADLYKVQMRTKAEIVSQRDSKSSAYKRLVDKKVTDKTTWLNEQAQLAEHQLDLDKAEILKQAAQVKLNILAVM
jgi:outer membrane protein TolC